MNLRNKLTILTRNYKKPLTLLVMFLLLFAYKTISRNSDWKSFKTLYSNDIKYLDKSAKANAVYASFLYSEIYRTNDIVRQKQIATQSARYYRQAVKIYPDYTICLNNLGLIEYKFLNNKTEAVNLWRKAAGAEDNYAEPLFNIAMAYEEITLVDSAEKFYTKALAIDSTNIKGYSKLATLYFNQGNFQKAISINEKIAQIDSASDVPYINIGNYYFIKHDTVNAVKYWEQAIAKQPSNKKLCQTLAGYFMQRKDIEKAEYYQKLSRTIANKP